MRLTYSAFADTPLFRCPVSLGLLTGYHTANPLVSYYTDRIVLCFTTFFGLGYRT
jgi:hypothetical protein